MTNDDSLISQKQTTFFKGIAILCILIHNFFHWLPPLVNCENEIRFESKCVDIFINNFTLSSSINEIFSLFGFYGVFLFIFLSGYGLTKSFSKNSLPKAKFVFKHVWKIYKLFILSACLFLLINIKYVNYFIFPVLKSLSLTNNFYVAKIFSVNGPWWFFSLIIQLYILFIPILYALKRDKFNFILMFIPYLVLAYFMASNGAKNIFYANALGHIPEFSLGVYIALYEDDFRFAKCTKYLFLIFVTSLTIVVGAQFYFAFFTLSFVASAILLLSFFLLIQKTSNKFIEFTGTISPYLFGFNGFLFRRDFVKLANEWNFPFADILCCLIWLFICYFFAYIAYKLIQQKFKLIS